eukprot:TRINITY_DN6095_c0_g1_i1.p1 TRINITY_DN6095_c0_g1~~TRINITY_DN6095_c0_g1_i1.p1  ORF type:complete len:1127 (+),score=247.22 TRINITY_DN6095_c0_g1_i1:338-3718(+)
MSLPTATEPLRALDAKLKNAEDHSDFLSVTLQKASVSVHHDATLHTRYLEDQKGGIKALCGVGEVFQSYDEELLGRSLAHFGRVLNSLHDAESALSEQRGKKLEGALRESGQGIFDDAKNVKKLYDQSFQKWRLAEQKVNTERSRTKPELARLVDAENERDETMKQLEEYSQVSLKFYADQADTLRLNTTRGVVSYLQSSLAFFKLAVNVVEQGLLDVEEIASQEKNRAQARRLQRNESLKSCLDVVNAKGNDGGSSGGGGNDGFLRAEATRGRRLSSALKPNRASSAPHVPRSLYAEPVVLTAALSSSSREGITPPIVTISTSTTTTVATPTASGRLSSTTSPPRHTLHDLPTNLFDDETDNNCYSSDEESDMVEDECNSYRIRRNGLETETVTSASAVPTRALAQSLMSNQRMSMKRGEGSDSRAISERASTPVEGRTRSTRFHATSRPKLYTFEVLKVQSKTRSTFNKVLQVNVPKGTVSSYHVKDQVTIERDAACLLQVRRSKVNSRKVKLYWRDRVTYPERYVFSSPEERERFVEAAWYVRSQELGPGDASSSASTLFVPDQNLSIFVGTWNLGNAAPPETLSSWLLHKVSGGSDIYAIGLQEAEYPPRAGYPSCEADLFDTVQRTLGTDYIKVAGHSLLQMRLVVYVHRKHFYAISRVRKTHVATGIGGVIGNKGGVGVSLYFHETRLCFISTHLAAHVDHSRLLQRNQQIKDIIRGMDTLIVRSGNSDIDVSTFFHHVFWLGDLNYRVEMERTLSLQHIANGDLAELMKVDQLKDQKEQGLLLYNWKEGPIKFPPTYRFCRGIDEYTEEKMRTPSWCDRVLWKSLPGCTIQQLNYGNVPDIMTSDHRPVFSCFQIQPSVPPLPEEGDPFEIGLMGLKAQLLDGATQRKDGKPGTYTLTFSSPFFLKATKSTAILKTAAYTVLTWEDDQVPRLEPVVCLRDKVDSGHVFFAVKDGEVVLGQGVIPLRGTLFPGTSGSRLAMVPFHVDITNQCILAGSLDGNICIFPKANERMSAAAMSRFAKCGYLTKQGGAVKNWKRRWFTLTLDGVLSYYPERSAEKALNTVNLAKHKFEVGVEQTSHKNFCFYIETPKRKFLIAADSDAGMESWRMALLNFKSEKGK